MAELAVVFILLGFAAVFSLPVVVPWIVIRVMVFVLEADVEATASGSTASVSEPDRAPFDERATEADGVRRSRQAPAERGVRDR